MDGYPATNTASFNGQIGNSIGPIKFESEPYHYDVSNNNHNYGYDGSGTYGHVPFQPTGFQYTPGTQPQGTLQTNAQTPNLYNNQPLNQSSLPVAVNGDSKYITPKKPMNSSTEHHCDICDKVFSSSASMRRHREIHTGMKKFSCELCGNSYTQKHNLTKHMRVHTGEKPYKCHVCDKLFYIHHHLKNHMFQHTGELPFQCAKCNKRFKHKFRYERHLRTHEEGGNTDGSVAQTPPSLTSEDNSMSEAWNNKSDDDDDVDYDASLYDSFDEEGNKYDEHECEVCQQIFISKESLDNHFKLQHAVDREFKCDDCNSIFLTRAHLVRHRRTHTGEQIYECEECNVSFRWKVSLHIHMRRHNNDYKRFECTMCNKYFLAKESLKKHMNMHLGMTAQEQDDSEQKHTPKNENKNNSDGKQNGGSKSITSPKSSTPKQPPTCKTCHKTFSSNSSLRKHEFTHMDVKPHKCDLCNVSFAQKIQLRLHNKKHNGGKMDPPLFYRKKENQPKKESPEESDSKSEVSASKRKSPTKSSSPAKISPVRIKIDKSKIIPERRNAPRKARNIIKEEVEDEEEEEEGEAEEEEVVEDEEEDEEEEEEEEEEESSEEESEAESETEEDMEPKKSRWEGYRYPVCENCHQVFKKRKALLRHQRKCKKRE
ncbi:zinc finger protein 808-like [Ruditapes philippinarum]|uniref:zinc finger protein 808-like n=1 Tax=Ruditapes philippinarum TaxID=129788 RepID=UPI00295ABE81|nr:zinc finger protein 808-like [Ruditapes philippinarum]